MHFVRHRIRIGILCLAVKIFYISINNLYLFFEPRPSKTGRGEGGILCVKN